MCVSFEATHFVHCLMFMYTTMHGHQGGGGGGLAPINNIISNLPEVYAKSCIVIKKRIQRINRTIESSMWKFQNSSIPANNWNTQFQ